MPTDSDSTLRYAAVPTLSSDQQRRRFHARDAHAVPALISDQ
jgi:hypothetical protein